MKINPISIYIHIPFCIQKCSYCDFASYSIGRRDDQRENSNSRIDRYIDCLIDEIQGFDGRDYFVKTIFIGGGTPSAINADYITRIVKALQIAFPHKDSNMEFTIEINPGTVDEDQLQIYQSNGINRLSIGLQSTHNNHLRALGRIHSYEDFLHTYNLARSLGFMNINVDLMSGIPDLTVEAWSKTLEEIIMLNPEHISAYSLILEENTPLYNKYTLDQIQLPDEESERQMYYMTKELLMAAGYERYEISNYAKKGYECKHNIVYWTLEEYIGFGIAAASYIKNRRVSNTKHMKDYIAGIRQEEEYEQTLKSNMEEYMFLGLRIMEGIDKNQFLHKFGHSVENIYGQVITELIKQNLIIDKNHTLALTDKGIDVSNLVFEKFLLD